MTQKEIDWIKYGIDPYETDEEAAHRDYNRAEREYVEQLREEEAED